MRNATLQLSLTESVVTDLALSHLDEEDPVYPGVQEAVRGLLTDAVRPFGELTHDDLNLLEGLIDKLRDEGSARYDEAMIVSLHRIKRELGWVPESDPTAERLLSSTNGAYLAARNAFGVIALAWQIKAHPTDLWFTGGTALRAVS
ncbi:MAG: hypothetical protein RDU25_01450 [Patescibacteria group bacterium]|nr:hypothetical protein [Patescibacteria group bacterium]